MRQKILIAGGAGFLGMTWAKVSLDQFEVHVTLHQNKSAMAGVVSHQIDLGDASAVEKLIREVSPDIIVNTAGLTNVDKCEQFPDSAYQCNVGITENLAKYSAQYGVKFVHISTDHLVDGTKQLNSESDEVHPLNVYADTKRKAELACLQLNPDALIIRTNFFGKSDAVKGSFTDWIYNELKQKNSVMLAADVYFSPIYAPALVKAAHAAISKSAKGILNIAGKERLSKYDFGIQFAEFFGLDPSLIIRPEVESKKTKVKRPNEMALNLEKFEHLTEVKIDSLKTYFKLLKNELEGKL
ncbi:MAG: SDR family oxidoreductase [Bacteriovoracaceae bacterium]